MVGSESSCLGLSGAVRHWVTAVWGWMELYWDGCSCLRLGGAVRGFLRAVWGWVELFGGGTYISLWMDGAV